YNAMAAAVGGLPLINVNTRIGDPTSYPVDPTRLDGSPIPTGDIVFPNPPTIVVSDAASIGWSLGASDSVTNDPPVNYNLSVNAMFSMPGFFVGAQVGYGWGNSYAVTIGKDVLFSGSVPPIPNNPNTPEDEYKLYGYTFRPWVYRQTYTDAHGNPAAYHVI